MAPKKILPAVPDEKMLPEAAVLSETGHSTVEFPLAQLDPKRSHAARSTRSDSGRKTNPLRGRARPVRVR